jgi:hypothetical protein
VDKTNTEVKQTEELDKNTKGIKGRGWKQMENEEQWNRRT